MNTKPAEEMIANAIIRFSSPWILMSGLGIAHAGYGPIPALGFEACVGICLSLFAARIGLGGLPKTLEREKP